MKLNRDIITIAPQAMDDNTHNSHSIFPSQIQTLHNQSKTYHFPNSKLKLKQV